MTFLNILNAFCWTTKKTHFFLQKINNFHLVIVVTAKRVQKGCFCYKTSIENRWEINFVSIHFLGMTYESSPELEHITPAPSLPAQLSFPFPRWGHSSREDSYPRQRTSSIANVLETGPNWDFVVGCPEAYPSILTNIWFFQGKVRQTCKLQLHCRRHVHRHRRAGHPRRCFLHGVQILQPVLRLRFWYHLVLEFS